jgi:hypothetical protein
MDSQQSSSLWHKIIGSIFAAVIAPVVVAVSVNYTQKHLADTKAEESKAAANNVASKETAIKDAAIKEAATKEAAPKEAASDTAKSAETRSGPVVAREASPAKAARGVAKGPQRKVGRRAASTVRLFNGKNLDGWYTYLGAPGQGQAVLGKNNDPEQVFSVDKGNIRCTGKSWGGLVTDDEYENYHLTIEFRWGDQTWPPRESSPRISGVTLHCFGPDGAIRGDFPQGIRCQIGEGVTGNLLGVFVQPEHVLMSAPVLAHEGASVPAKKSVRTFYAYKPGAASITVPTAVVHRLGFYDNTKPAAKFQPGPDYEKPNGAWNTLECICAGDEITVMVNGTVVNHVEQLNHTQGRICLISESAEIFYRKVELKMLAPSIAQ